MRTLRVNHNGGTEVQQVELKGDPRNPEPIHFRVCFPFGDVDIVRCSHPDIPGKAPDYWIHVRVNRPNDGDDPDRDFGRVTDGRADLIGRHASEVDPGLLADPNLYHLAIKVGPA